MVHEKVIVLRQSYEFIRGIQEDIVKLYLKYLNTNDYNDLLSIYDKQKQLFNSNACLLKAIKIIFSNEGFDVAGIDGVICNVAYMKKLYVLIKSLIINMKFYFPMKVKNIFENCEGVIKCLKVPTIKDRIIQEMIRMCIDPIFETKVSCFSYGFRTGISGKIVIAKIKYLLKRNLEIKYLLKVKITCCNDAVFFKKRILEKIVFFDLSLVEKIIESGIRIVFDFDYYFRDILLDESSVCVEGAISCMFCNLFLNDLDKLLEYKYCISCKNDIIMDSNNNKIYFVRYMGNILLFFNNKNIIHSVKDLIINYLDNIGFVKNLDFFEEIELKCGCFFDFLGYNIHIDKFEVVIVPSKSTISIFKMKLKSFYKYKNLSNIVININYLIIIWCNYYNINNKCLTVSKDIVRYVFNLSLSWLKKKYKSSYFKNFKKYVRNKTLFVKNICGINIYLFNERNLVVSTLEDYNIFNINYYTVIGLKKINYIRFRYFYNVYCSKMNTFIKYQNYLCLCCGTCIFNGEIIDISTNISGFKFEQVQVVHNNCLKLIILL